MQVREGGGRGGGASGLTTAVPLLTLDLQDSGPPASGSTPPILHPFPSPPTFLLPLIVPPPIRSVTFLIILHLYSTNLVYHMYLAHSLPTLIHPVRTFWSSFSPPVLCPLMPIQYSSSALPGPYSLLILPSARLIPIHPVPLLLILPSAPLIPIHPAPFCS
jgi:hypothetical protein